MLGIEFYRCIKRNPKYCPGRAYIEEGWQQGEGYEFKLGRPTNRAHNHVPVHSSKRDAQMKLKQAATQGAPPTRNILDDVRSDMPENVLTKPGNSRAAMGRSYCRYVQREKADQGDALLDAGVIPIDIQPITVFDGQINGTRAIIFMSQFGSSLLERYGQNVVMDGTFKVNILKMPNFIEILKVCPAPFYQLFNISVILDYSAVPVVYALLGNKERDTYEGVASKFLFSIVLKFLFCIKVFGHLRNAVPAWAPATFLSDFEQASIRAAEFVSSVRFFF